MKELWEELSTLIQPAIGSGVPGELLSARYSAAFIGSVSSSNALRKH